MPRNNALSKRTSGKPVEQLIFIDDLEVWIRRKRVKNLSIYVKSPSARIEVSAPLRMSDARIRQFVSQKASWIRRKQEEILASPHSKAEEAGDEEKKLWRDVVSSFTPALIEKWEPVMGVKAGEIAYRNMRSRWGSCKPSTGRICINTRLGVSNTWLSMSFAIFLSAVMDQDSMSLWTHFFPIGRNAEPN